MKQLLYCTQRLGLRGIQSKSLGGFMFYISRVKDSEAGVVDTRDNVEEFYSKEDLYNIVKQGIKISGVSDKGVRVVELYELAQYYYSRLKLVGGVFKEETLSGTVLSILVKNINKSVLTIPYGVTSIVGVELSTQGSQALKEVRLSDTVKVIGTNLFAECVNLVDIAFPKMLEEIKIMAFENTGLTRLVLNGNEADKLILDECAFALSRLKEVDIHKQIGSLSMGVSCFKRCAELERVSIDAKCELEDMLFMGCLALTSVRINSCIQTIPSSCFAGCCNLEVLEFAEGSNIKKIKTNAFDGAVRLYKFDFSKVHSICESAFTKSGIKEFKPTSSLQVLSISAFESSCLVSVDLSNTILELLSEKVFKDCKFLQKVVLNNSLDYIQRWCFQSCSELSGVSFPESMVEIRKSAFEGCTNLRDLNGLKHLHEISDEAFMHTGLENVHLSCTYIGKNAFAENSDLQCIILEDVNSIDNSAFALCTNLREVKITSKAPAFHLGIEVFLNCTSLKKVELPDTLVELRQKVFKGCSNLERVVITGKVERLTDGCFMNCVSLRELILPPTCTMVAETALVGVCNLERLVCDSASVIVSIVKNNGRKLKEVVYKGKVYRNINRRDFLELFSQYES